MTAVQTIQMNSPETLLDALMSLPEADRPRFIMGLPAAYRERFAKFWRLFAHPHQKPPERANNGAPWTTWLILGGRGAGKTRAGAEWVRTEACTANARIALIGETARDVREVRVEGVSGLLDIHPDNERPVREPSRGRVEW